MIDKESAENARLKLGVGEVEKEKRKDGNENQLLRAKMQQYEQILGVEADRYVYMGRSQVCIKGRFCMKTLLQELIFFLIFIIYFIFLLV